MAECNYCKELNEEKEEIRIDEIYINRAGHYGYECPIKYCPNCGTILDKYKSNGDISVIKTIRKYLQQRQNDFFQQKYKEFIKKDKLTDYERGYNAGICHMTKVVNRILHDDIKNIENIIFDKNEVIK